MRCLACEIPASEGDWCFTIVSWTSIKALRRAICVLQTTLSSGKGRFLGGKKKEKAASLDWQGLHGSLLDWHHPMMWWRRRRWWWWGCYWRWRCLKRLKWHAKRTLGEWSIRAAERGGASVQGPARVLKPLFFLLSYHQIDSAGAIVGPRLQLTIKLQ